MATAKSTAKVKPAKKKVAKSKPARSARPATVDAYLDSLAPGKREVIAGALEFVRANIPGGYAEFMSWGVINWGIPLSEFANTYNGHPLCYVALGANKNNVSLYLMGSYGDARQTDFLKDEFKKAGKKFDMGKSCLHFKALGDLETNSVAKVIGMVTAEQFLENYKKMKGLA
jgi:hypothetical protein